jgi:hypothetical protein
MLQILIGVLLLLYSHLAAAAAPVWASGIMEIEGDPNWMIMLLMAGVVAALSMNKVLVAKHTPNVAGCIKWVGRAAVIAVILVIIGPPFFHVDPHSARLLLGIWSFAKVSHALYISGMEAGFRIDTDARNSLQYSEGLDTEANDTPVRPMKPRAGQYMIAWAPSGLAAPIELTAVRLPYGEVTEQQWLRALSARVTAMAAVAGIEKVRWACSLLGPDIDMAREVGDAGKVLVEDNFDLRTWILGSVLRGTPFPSRVEKPDAYAAIALGEVDFEAWVELARSLTHPGAAT